MYCDTTIGGWGREPISIQMTKFSNGSVDIKKTLKNNNIHKPSWFTAIFSNKAKLQRKLCQLISAQLQEHKCTTTNADEFYTKYKKVSMKNYTSEDAQDDLKFIKSNYTKNGNTIFSFIDDNDYKDKMITIGSNQSKK